MHGAWSGCDIMYFSSLTLITSMCICTCQGLPRKPADTLIAAECFGSILSLSCPMHHRIKVVDDFFGLRPPRRDSLHACQYMPGDCTVTSSRLSSVFHRYCEGRSECSQFQVDRRVCGSNLTTYEQVEFLCIPDQDVADVCTSTKLAVSSGYLATPNFPSEYPPNRHCGCSLKALDPGNDIRLAFTQFIIRFDDPCKDWVEVKVKGHSSRRICGAFRSSITGNDIQLIFHSDGEFGHQGFWLHFDARSSNAQSVVSVLCGPVESERITLSMKPPKSTRPSKMSTFRITATTTTTTTSTTPASILPPIETETTFLATPEVTAIQVLHPRQGTLGNRQPRQRNVTTMEIRKENAPQNPRLVPGRAESTIKEIRYGIPLTSSVFPHSADDSVHSQEEESPNYLLEVGANYWSSEEEITFPPPPDSNSRPELNMSRKGMVIISICVGGIILLIIILVVLLAINKRCNPNVASMKAKKEQIQQRISSLSFYDSIPLYNSVGRKGGVPRAPATRMDSSSGKGKRSAPYWTDPNMTVNSDVHTSLYAELNPLANGKRGSVHDPLDVTLSTDSTPEVRRNMSGDKLTLEMQDPCPFTVSTHV